MELIELRDICKTYHLGEVQVPVLRGISLSVSRGDLVALMGTSGSGKTTLMNILGCLDHPSSGQYWFDGQDVVELSADKRALLRNQKIGFIFQNFNLLPRTSALDNVMMPLTYTAAHLSEREARQRAEAVLHRVGLGEQLNHEPSQLSGGQQQRVAIARALINHPSLLFADEPTGNLDSRTSEEVLQIFQQLNEEEGVTIILVTHDPNVARHAQRVIRINDGVIEAEPPPATAAIQPGRSQISEDHAVALSNASPPLLLRVGTAVDFRFPLPQGEGQGEGKTALKAPPALSPKTPERKRRAAVKSAALPSAGRASRSAERGSGGAFARLRRMLRTALNGLRRNVLRAALTALGIIIGVAAVITMMEIGRGSSTAIQRSVASMGANNLLVMPGTASSGGVSFGAGSVMTLTPQDAEAIVSESPAVKGAAPIVRARTQVIYGNRNWVPTFIYGTTPEYLRVRDWNLADGAVFSERDVRNASKVCLLGQRLVRELFQGEDPLGKEVRVQNVAFKVIGILTSKGANMMGLDQDDILLAPWTTIKYRVTATSLANVNQSSSSSGSATSGQVNTLNQIYPGSQNSLYPLQSATQAADTPLPVRFANVDQILTAAKSTEEVPAAIRQITQLLRERHRIRPDEPEDFSVRDMTEMTKALASTATMMTKLLLAVALISLVVGGVGIMNIMLVSVTERTREIGLRMAVGARSGLILQQFLVESMVLCFCGGAFGILVGRGISYLVSIVLRWPTELSLDAILAAFLVSATVGIVFGYYPAWKASRMDPIIALRYE